MSGCDYDRSVTASGGAKADPRVLRTHHDVVETVVALLRDEGWDAVTHAEVARRAGYSKVTVYAHWPTRLDLIGAAIDRICEESGHPIATGDLQHDLRVSLLDFAHDLTEGQLDRLLGGVVERANSSTLIRELRARLYESGTRALRAILAAHLPQEDVDTTLELLVGAVFVHVTFRGEALSAELTDELIKRVLRV